MNYLHKGFTLIEVIIVVGIIGIIIGGSVKIYSRTIVERQLDKEADGIVNILQTAKDRAMARDISPLIPFPGCNNFVGYGLSIQSTGTFSDTIICDATQTVLNTYSLENAVFHNLSPSPMQLSFMYPYGSLNTTTSRIIQIKSTHGNQCIRITIPRLGPIDKSTTYSC